MLTRLTPCLLIVCAGCQAIAPMPPTAERAVSNSDDALQKAAACVEAGDEAGAVPHMIRHIEAHPDQIMIRAYLAELLLKLNRLADAQRQFERFVGDAQEADGPARKHLVHCHTRLMEIAQDREDAYGEKLHRGIGLLLLARQQSALAEADDPAALFQQLLCKAARELNEAREARPDDARPCWYLFEVWTALDQRRPAERALLAAKETAPFCLSLTRSERMALAASSSSRFMR